MSDQKQKTLSDLSVSELKAICYDQVVQINKSNEIIKAVEAEIARRNMPIVPPVQKTPPKEKQKKEPTEKDPAA